MKLVDFENKTEALKLSIRQHAAGSWWRWKGVPCSSCSNKITTSNSYLHYNPKQFPPKGVCLCMSDMLFLTSWQTLWRSKLSGLAGEQVHKRNRRTDWAKSDPIGPSISFHIPFVAVSWSHQFTCSNGFSWKVLGLCWDPLGLMLRRSLWEQECLEKCSSIPQDAQGGCQGTHRGFHSWFGSMLNLANFRIYRL